MNNELTVDRKHTTCCTMLLRLTAGSLQVSCSHESAACFGQRSGRVGLSGLAAAQEGGPQLPGKQMEEILVCPEEEFAVLVQ